MNSTQSKIQNEFKILVDAHFESRRSSGSTRSKWPGEVVAKFAELLRHGHDVSFFESAFGLTNHQFHSLKSRLKPKKPIFKKLRLENLEAKKLSSTLYLRSAGGVELRGIQSFDEAVELFVKAAR